MIDEYSFRDEVLAAVRQNGWVLRLASEDLREDKEVVLAAVKENSWALELALGDLRKHPLLKSIAAETKRGKVQNISYELFCFAEKTPELYLFKLSFLTSKKIRSICEDKNAVSSGNTHQLVFNFAKHQLNNKKCKPEPIGQLDNQKCKPEPKEFCRCVI